MSAKAIERCKSFHNQSNNIALNIDDSSPRGNLLEEQVIQNHQESKKMHGGWLVVDPVQDDP